jgi:hypothetical protein
VPSGNDAAVWLTLAGLKLLMRDFAEDQAMWRLIALKARNALKKKGHTEEAIDLALSQITVALEI